MTSVVFLRLLHDGVFKSLDDDIGLYSKTYRNVLPAAYAGEKITFRHLLTHRSGIPHLDKPLWADGKLNLLFRPGARFEYTTNGFSILGEIMSEVTGRSFSDLVKEHIGGPVGASSFWAETHFRAPGARIHSSPRDYARFVQGIINNSYMNEEEFDKILVGRKSEESLGWGTGRIGTPDLTLGHSGSNGRPRSHLLIKPKKKLALVLMGETKTRDSDIWFLHLAPILMDILEGKGGY
jgi:CubicO group peptidase (beta-lactamase class C family)